MTTVDSTVLRADQTCWTADGLNACSPPQNTYGWRNLFAADSQRRASLRKKIEDDEAEVESIPDALDREISQFLHEQEAKDAERAEIERLRTLARSYNEGDIDARFAAALEKAANARTLAAARVLEMEVARVQEEEEFLMAATMLLIDD